MLVYSSLVGLLNARKFEVGELILDLVMAELKKTLTLAQYDTTRHLVRSHPSDHASCLMYSMLGDISC